MVTWENFGTYLYLKWNAFQLNFDYIDIGLNIQ